MSESHPGVLQLVLPPGAHPVFSGSARDDERDAALAGISAWALVHASPGWRDFFDTEDEHFAPVEEPLSYWMPEAVLGEGS